MKAEVLNSWYINSGDWCSSLRSSTSQGCMLAASSRSSDRLASNAAHVHAKPNTASAAKAAWCPYADDVMLYWRCEIGTSCVALMQKAKHADTFLMAQACTTQTLHKSVYPGPNGTTGCTSLVNVYAGSMKHLPWSALDPVWVSHVHARAMSLEEQGRARGTIGRSFILQR